MNLKTSRVLEEHILGDERDLKGPQPQTGYYNNGFAITNNMISQIGLGLWLWECEGGVVAENVINQAIARAVVFGAGPTGNSLFKNNVINGGNSDGVVINLGGDPAKSM